MEYTLIVIVADYDDDDDDAAVQQIQYVLPDRPNMCCKSILIFLFIFSDFSKTE